jgi:hypothetical protein
VKPKRLLTDEENKHFDACIAEWQICLNLSDWRVERGSGIAKGAMASVVTNYGARLASYRTGDWKGDPVTPDTIKATALHEMLHVLLAEVLCLKSSAGAEPELLESAEHRVVNTLEKLLRDAR